MQRSAVLWGSLLILFGGVLILARLGLVDVINWMMLWPLALIGVGLLALLGARRQPTSANLTTEQLVMELKGADTAEIEFDFDGTGLQIDGSSAPEELLHGSFTGGVAYEANDLGHGQVRLALRVPEDAQSTWQQREWYVSLNAALPITMRCVIGSSTATIDLHDTQVRALDVRTRGGNAEITLPEAAGYTLVAIKGVAEGTVVTIPAGVAALIRISADNANLTIDEVRFPLMATNYQSADYGTALNRVEIVIESSTDHLAIR